VTVDRALVKENTEQRERLRTLLGRLSDADLARPLEAGWTVASVLGHVAFWDQRILALLETLERGGPLSRPLDRSDVDWINDAGKPMLLAVEPRRMARMALEIAEAVDRKIEALSVPLVTRMAEAGNPINLARAPHRRDHLDEIERAIGR
jgi:hypothetical protein